MTTEQLFMVLAGLAFAGSLILYVGIYNRIQSLVNIIPEVASNITVLGKKRTDLISKLLTVVESYGIHESSIAAVVAAEFAGTTTKTTTASTVARLASLRMAFPELKADSLYDNLMQELTQVESQIANRREQYNSTIRAYNTTLAQFPNNVLLLPFGFLPKQFLSDQELAS